MELEQAKEELGDVAAEKQMDENEEALAMIGTEAERTDKAAFDQPVAAMSQLSTPSTAITCELPAQHWI